MADGPMKSLAMIITGVGAGISCGIWIATDSMPWLGVAVLLAAAVVWGSEWPRE